MFTGILLQHIDFAVWVALALFCR